MNETKKRVKTPKLLTTLKEKNNYVCHCRNLPLYITLGMKLKKICRVLEFSQSPFLKEYLVLNTKRCQAAKGEFQKSFFLKLMNKSVFGKTMEILRNSVNVNAYQKETYQAGGQVVFRKMSNFQWGFGSSSIKKDCTDIEQTNKCWEEYSGVIQGCDVWPPLQLRHDKIWTPIGKAYDDRYRLTFILHKDGRSIHGYVRRYNYGLKEKLIIWQHEC